jgi:hypothetical protein
MAYPDPSVILYVRKVAGYLEWANFFIENTKILLRNNSTYSTTSRFPDSSYILICNNTKMSIKRDSTKKKRANPGSRKDIGLFWRLAVLIEMMISTMSQIRLIVGTNANRNNRVLNAASVRLNPKSKSNLAPIIRRIST